MAMHVYEVNVSNNKRRAVFSLFNYVGLFSLYVIIITLPLILSMATLISFCFLSHNLYDVPHYLCPTSMQI